MKIQSTFRDMVNKSFLKWVRFWDICPFPLRDMRYFSNYLKRYGIPKTLESSRP